MTRRFVLEATGSFALDDAEMPPYMIHIVVFDTTARFHEALKRVNGYTDEEVKDVGGTFTPAKSPGRNNQIGVIRLSAEMLYRNSIIHEAIHAAVLTTQTFYGCNPLRLYTTGSGPREEFLAYAAASMAHQMLEVLADDIVEDD